MMTARESAPGVITLTIVARAYGQAGEHWRNTLSGPDNGGYGRIYIERSDAEARRRMHTAGLRSYYRGQVGANIDECPGAMFIWTAPKAPSTEAVDAIDNQALGRDMGRALRPFQPTSTGDMWEVRFLFL